MQPTASCLNPSLPTANIGWLKSYSSLEMRQLWQRKSSPSKLITGSVFITDGKDLVTGKERQSFFRAWNMSAIIGRKNYERIIHFILFLAWEQRRYFCGDGLYSQFRSPVVKPIRWFKTNRLGRHKFAHKKRLYYSRVLKLEINFSVHVAQVYVLL